MIQITHVVLVDTTNGATLTWSSNRADGGATYEELGRLITLIGGATALDEKGHRRST